MYGFSPNKTESTYKRFLDILLSLLPNAAPDKVLIDFELAAMKGFEKTLPNATISGCFFHQSQNYIRKIGQLGLKNLYRSNPELSLAMKLIPALAFEKLENVRSSFKLVVEDIQEVCEQLSVDSSEVEKIDELCSYFQNTYREKSLREPLFPHRYGTKEKLHRKALLDLQMRLTVGILWHPSVFSAGKFEEGCCHPKVSLFAVNSRYGVFE